MRSEIDGGERRSRVSRIKQAFLAATMTVGLAIGLESAEADSGNVSGLNIPKVGCNASNRGELVVENISPDAIVIAVAGTPPNSEKTESITTAETVESKDAKSFVLPASFTRGEVRVWNVAKPDEVAERDVCSELGGATTTTGPNASSTTSTTEALDTTTSTSIPGAPTPKPPTTTTTIGGEIRQPDHSADKPGEFGGGDLPDTIDLAGLAGVQGNDERKEIQIGVLGRTG